MRQLTLYHDDSTVQVVCDDVKAVFWTAGNTVLVISQCERFCWFKDDPHAAPQPPAQHNQEGGEADTQPRTHRTRGSVDIAQPLVENPSPAAPIPEGEIAEWRNLAIHRLTYTPDANGAAKLSAFLTQVQEALGKAIAQLSAAEARAQSVKEECLDAVRDHLVVFSRDDSCEEYDAGWMACAISIEKKLAAIRAGSGKA